MLNIDERFNIIKSTQDWQMMKLELYNVNIDTIKNGIIEVYNESFNYKKECLKFYEHDGCVLMFFHLDNKVPKGEYTYNITITFKTNETENIISERGYIVNE